MTSKPGAVAHLTLKMEADGVYLQTDDSGGVHIRAHLGDEQALERWGTPGVLSYVETHRAELWAWLRAPVSSLPAADQRSLFGPGGTGG